MATFQEWMVANRFEKFLDDFEHQLGVQTVSDLAYVTAADLEQLGVMPVQRRPFEELVAVPLVPTSLTVGPRAISSFPAPPSAAQSRASPVDASKERVTTTRPRADACGADGRESGSDTDAEYDGSPDEESSSNDEAVAGSTRRVYKKRKFGQARSRRNADDAAVLGGIARPQHLLTRYSNGTARAPSQSATSAGKSRISVDADGRCSCKSVIASFADRFSPARRMARERRRAEESGVCKGGQNEFNDARLGPIVVELLFDGGGNAVVHEKCVRAFLGVSNSWLASRHKAAIKASQAPTVIMTKAEISSSPIADDIINRIIRPDTCLLSLSQFFSSSAGDSRFRLLATYTSHALSVRLSNRMKQSERELFVAFVRAHRTPTGCTSDKSGRYHGAAYYSDAKWTVMRCVGDNKGVGETRLSFSAAFIEALVASGMPKVNNEVPLRWLKEYFSSTRRVDGMMVPSEEHTTRYQHKTDACSTCECLRSDLRSARQVVKCHAQQSDQGFLIRQQAIAEVKQTIDDLQTASEKHEEEAATAVHHHRTCVADSSARYGRL